MLPAGAARFWRPTFAAHTPLIATLFGSRPRLRPGALARRLRLPPLAGYVLAGIAGGPYTPGFAADSALALDLAEIGVILLMAGVGLHLSPRDLLSVEHLCRQGADFVVTGEREIARSMTQHLDIESGLPDPAFTEAFRPRRS